MQDQNDKIINGNNICCRCHKREVSIKISYANGVYILCCSRCAPLVQVESEERKKERVQ